MSGNGIRALAWVAVRDGLGRRSTDDAARGRHRRRPAELDLELDPATGELAYATVDMGPVTFDPARDPGRGRLVGGHHRRVPRRGLRGRRRGHGQPAPGAVRRRPRDRARHPARPAPRTRRALPAAHQRALRARHAGRARRARHAGVGTRRGRDAELRHRGLRGGRGRAPARAGGGARHRARSRRRPHRRPRRLAGDTIRLGGPVVHVFDTTVELA